MILQKIFFLLVFVSATFLNLLYGQWQVFPTAESKPVWIVKELSSSHSPNVSTEIPKDTFTVDTVVTLCGQTYNLAKKNGEPIVYYRIDGEKVWFRRYILVDCNQSEQILYNFGPPVEYNIGFSGTGACTYRYEDKYYIETNGGVIREVQHYLGETSSPRGFPVFLENHFIWGIGSTTSPFQFFTECDGYGGVSRFLLSVDSAGVRIYDRMNVNVVTSTTSVESDDNISVFPNPTYDNKVTLQSSASGKMTIDIFNSIGVKINTMDFNINSTEPVQVDLPEKQGIYFIRINNEKNKIIRVLSY